MMIVLQENCPMRDKAEILKLLEEHGVGIRVSETQGHVAFILTGTNVGPLVDQLAAHPAVDELRSQSPPYLLVARDHGSQSTRIQVNHVTISSDEFVVIAGPCAVESREQIREIALGVAQAGGVMLRGGAYKPRTSPYSFQGLGELGLEYLADAGRVAGLPVITEVISPEDVNIVTPYVDMLQIGARNMQNFPLLNAVGLQSKPVLLKRSPMASIEEWLCAAEYVAHAGNSQIIMCERGLRTFESSTRNTLDISAVPVLKESTHLPVFIDPSHAAGRRELVPSLAYAAVAAGADGLLIEVHNTPEKAWSDGRQSITIPTFIQMMEKISHYAHVADRKLSNMPMGNLSSYLDSSL